MKKRVFLIHGWEGYPEEGWRPWLKNELEKRGFEVIVPAMPNTKNPIYQEWLAYLKKIVGQAGECDYFVGHSLGCITILRFIASLEKEDKIGGAVLVSGFTDSLGYKELVSFFEDPIDFSKIKSHCQKFIAIHSDNDPYVSLKYSEIFKDKLGAKIVIEHDKKHFSGDDNIFELSSALSAVLELSG